MFEISSFHVKSDLETKASRTFTTYKAISYRTQVVSGINYFIKVDVGDQYYHLRIFNPLPYMNSGPSLVAYQRGKTGKSELSYFK
ncbi:cystatin-B-like isoform X2 [Haliotis rubra]|uniref:cystatin-B-like isoform X2 n=1 Tax=Haliotis rubra TaxID=36100 RepID=UPI001EE58EF0|nr:cystatin-B-like isoform X2 [Haliotis rubra]